MAATFALDALVTSIKLMPNLHIPVNKAVSLVISRFKVKPIRPAHVIKPKGAVLDFFFFFFFCPNRLFGNTPLRG